LKINHDPIKHHGNCDAETELYHEAYEKAHTIAMFIREQKAYGILEAKKEIMRDGGVDVVTSRDMASASQVRIHSNAN